jgi:molybdopterin molybdotransferase
MALIAFDAALNIVRAQSRLLPMEFVASLHSMGRVLAESVSAVRTLPYADTSAMDGYALKASPQSHFSLVDTVWAGEHSKIALGPQQAAKIMTGGYVPLGADAVVKREEVERGEGKIQVLKTTQTGDFIRRMGEDTLRGTELLPAGTRVATVDLGALVAQNILTLAVYRRPRLGVLASGDELHRFGSVVTPQSIIDVNSHTLAQLGERDADVLVGAIAADSKQSIQTCLNPLLHCDVVVVVGGASVGERDFTKVALQELGVSWHFSGVAMKPGKPVAYGTRTSAAREAQHFFALPGHVVSALVTFELLVRPCLLALQGGSPPRPSIARLATPVQPLAGLTHFMRGHIENTNGTLFASALPTQSSGALRSAFSATHLIKIPAGSDELPTDSPVEILGMPWD